MRLGLSWFLQLLPERYRPTAAPTTPPATTLPAPAPEASAPAGWAHPHGEDVVDLSRVTVARIAWHVPASVAIESLAAFARGMALPTSLSRPPSFHATEAFDDALAAFIDVLKHRFDTAAVRGIVEVAQQALDRTDGIAWKSRSEDDRTIFDHLGNCLASEATDARGNVKLADVLHVIADLAVPIPWNSVEGREDGAWLRAGAVSNAILALTRAVHVTTRSRLDALAGPLQNGARRTDAWQTLVETSMQLTQLARDLEGKAA